MRIISCFNPVEFDKSSNRFKEVAWRFEKLFETLVLLPAAIASLPLATASRVASNSLTKKNFYYLSGKGHEKVDGDQVSISQQNVCANGFASYFAGAVDYHDHRIHKVIGRLIKFNNDEIRPAEFPELIFIQEAGDRSAVKKFYNRLKPDYAHFFFDMGVKPFPEQNKLKTFS